MSFLNAIKSRSETLAPEWREYSELLDREAAGKSSDADARRFAEIAGTLWVTPPAATIHLAMAKLMRRTCADIAALRGAHGETVKAGAQLAKAQRELAKAIDAVSIAETAKVEAAGRYDRLLNCVGTVDGLRTEWPQLFWNTTPKADLPDGDPYSDKFEHWTQMARQHGRIPAKPGITRPKCNRRGVA